MDVLAAAIHLLGDGEGLNILSFGCSIGDELATLRSLFPRARLQGCDINREALAIATASVGHLAEVFESDEAAIRARGPYDLICAFSVLCVNPMPKPEEMPRIFPFSQFEDMVGLLAGVLKPGGLLALKNTSYLFSQTEAFADFDICRIGSTYQNGYVAVLHKDQRIALSIQNTLTLPMHRIVDVEGLSDWDFIDSLFRKRGGPGGQEIIPISVIQDRPPGSREIGRWTRSNLDMLRPGVDRTGLLEIRQEFVSFTSSGHPGRVLLEQTSLRQPLDGGPLRQVAFHRVLSDQ